MGYPVAAPARQHPDPGARRRHRRDSARGQPGLAHQPLRIPRAALAGLGADVAVRDPGLRPGVRLRRPAGFRRTGAEPAARVVRQRPAVAARTLHRRGDPGPGAGVLSLCLPARAQRLHRPGQGPDGSRAGPRPVALAGVPAGRPADGAAGDRRRPGAGGDGNPGRLRRGIGVQLRYLHHRYLQDLVRLLQPLQRRPAGQPVVARGMPGAARRAPHARPGQGRQRASARRAAVPPARRQGAGGERLVRAGVPLRLRDSRGATGCLVLAPGPFRPRRALLGPDRPYSDAGRHRRTGDGRRGPAAGLRRAPGADPRYPRRGGPGQPRLCAAGARSWRFRSCWPSVGWTITG